MGGKMVKHKQSGEQNIHSLKHQGLKQTHTLTQALNMTQHNRIPSGLKPRAKP